jgi:hypothetical protein
MLIPRQKVELLTLGASRWVSGIPLSGEIRWVMLVSCSGTVGMLGCLLAASRGGHVALRRSASATQQHSARRHSTPSEGGRVVARGAGVLWPRLERSARPEEFRRVATSRSIGTGPIGSRLGPSCAGRLPSKATWFARRRPVALSPRSRISVIIVALGHAHGAVRGCCKPAITV